jgi:acetyl-CoA acetyltransferase
MAATRRLRVADAAESAAMLRGVLAGDAGTARDIVSIELEAGGPQVRADEGIRGDSTLEKLGSLKAAFEDPAMSERFPQIQWSVSAGNSSQVSDGAAAVLIC